MQQAAKSAMVKKSGFTSARDFYPYYLSEHSNVTCRRLHFLGTTIAITCLALAVLRLDPKFLLGCLLGGYGCAWVGHFFFEKNRPATFQYPRYSLICDFYMYKDIWTGKIRF